MGLFNMLSYVGVRAAASQDGINNPSLVYGVVVERNYVMINRQRGIFRC